MNCVCFMDGYIYKESFLFLPPYSRLSTVQCKSVHGSCDVLAHAGIADQEVERGVVGWGISSIIETKTQEHRQGVFSSWCRVVNYHQLSVGWVDFCSHSLTPSLPTPLHSAQVIHCSCILRHIFSFKGEGRETSKFLCGH